MTPTIRPIRPEELELVVHLWRRSRAAAQPWLEERMRDIWTDDMGFFRDTIATENQIWVAVDGSTIVGFMAIHDALLNYLYVDPPAQARGVGTVLLSKAQTLSPGGLTLFTHQRNAKARMFYERRGLRAVAFGVSPAPESEPDVKYAWEPQFPLPAAGSGSGG